MTSNTLTASKVSDLLEIMRRLRDPERGCPWDLEQTFATIVPHTIEEAYEVADCIERGDLVELTGELGDLLFQVVFYAQIASEQGVFGFDDIVDAIANKLIERHPHVFADASVSDAAEQTRRWEAAKAAERAARDESAKILDGIPRGLPALTRARKLQQRAAAVGFDWPDSADVRAKVSEEFAEVETAIAGGEQAEVEEEIGDLLFACVNWARHFGVDPESALRAASRKFERRFGYVEQSLTDSGSSVAGATLETMDGLWEDAKAIERGEPPSGKKKRVR